MGWWNGILAASCMAICVSPCAMAQEQPSRATICGGDVIARGTASRTIDGRTFALDDGREVRLAGIEAPPLPLPQESGAPPGGGGNGCAWIPEGAGPIPGGSGDWPGYCWGGGG